MPKTEYIIGRQSSPLECYFGIELGPNPNSKIISKPILDPLLGSLPYYQCTKPNSVGERGGIGIWENPNPT